MAVHGGAYPLFMCACAQVEESVVKVERKSEKNVVDLLEQLVAADTKLVTELASIRKVLTASVPEQDAKIKPGVVQFVTGCAGVLNGDCASVR